MRGWAFASLADLERFTLGVRWVSPEAMTGLTRLRKALLEIYFLWSMSAALLKSCMGRGVLFLFDLLFWSWFR